MRISDWSSEVCSSDLRCASSAPRRIRVTHTNRAMTGSSVNCTAWPGVFTASATSPRASLTRESHASRSSSGIAPSGPERHSGKRSRNPRSEEHTSELQSLMRRSYAVFCLKQKQYYEHLTDYHTNNHTTA